MLFVSLRRSLAALMAENRIRNFQGYEVKP
jgi:hypothetical protein